MSSVSVLGCKSVSGVCVFESLPVKEGSRECVHCTLIQ